VVLRMNLAWYLSIALRAVLLFRLLTLGTWRNHSFCGWNRLPGGLHLDQVTQGIPDGPRYRGLRRAVLLLLVAKVEGQSR
jgi:hypothetical protein